MRIILFTGKGGVGKTTMAAATALGCARQGHKTLVISTDAAHSLADSFDVVLGPDPTLITENLWGQETAIYHAMRQNWSEVQEYISSLLHWNGISEVMSDEIAVLPGMEEVANLFYVDQYQQQGFYDVLILDLAPTGETLRLLSLPEILAWWMKHLYPTGRRLLKIARPFMGAVSNMPMPTDGVVDKAKEMIDKLGEIRDTLSNADISSVRLVLTPEKMVIKEAQRNLTYLDLYGYHTDMVIVNRYFEEDTEAPFFNSLKKRQKEYFERINADFAPLPIKKVPMMSEEVLGLDMLMHIADTIYGTEDPSKIFYNHITQHIEKTENGGYILTKHLPFASKEKMGLKSGPEEIDIMIGDYRHNIILPHILSGREVIAAKFEEGTLTIEFSSEVNTEGEEESK